MITAVFDGIPVPATARRVNANNLTQFVAGNKVCSVYRLVQIGAFIAIRAPNKLIAIPDTEVDQANTSMQ